MAYEISASPNLAVSFQRYPMPPSGAVSALPRSHGALPVYPIGRDLIAVPVSEGEAFWIGLVATGYRSSVVRLLATTRAGDRLDPITGAPVRSLPAGAPSMSGRVVVPPSHSITGILRSPDTWWPFTFEPASAQAPACVGLRLTVLDGAELPEAADDPRRLRLTGGGAAAMTPPPGDRGAVVRVLRVRLRSAEEFTALSGLRLPPPANPRWHGGRLP